MAKTLLRVSVALLSLVLAISIVVLVFSVLEYQARNPTVPTPPPIIINSETLTHHDEHPERPVQTFDENPVVYTEYGGLRGRKQFTLFENKSYYAFKGIPYAKPPLAELRFKPPQRAARWFGIRDATQFGNNCVQRAPIGSEDCLFVNVYTPKASNDVRFPVIVAIHGGAFTDTSADTLGPDFLLNQADVVVVTFNYRLGPLGFMSLRTPEYSGNMGLKDQLLAMQWTFQNIHHFGGDNSEITLYGISAGAQSAHMHVLSPASYGLFNRAVMASGTALNPSSISSADHADRLRRFAAENGNAVANDQELIEYLHRVDAHLLTINTTGGPTSVTDARRGIPLYWVPVVEPIGAEQPFLVTSPSDILNNNFRTSVDLMFTFVSAESYWFIDEELRNPELLNQFDEEFEVQMPLYPLNIGFNHSSELYRSVLSPKIRSFYFGENDGKVNTDSLYEYSWLVSDTRFNYAVDQSVRLHAASGPGKTFYLRFSVDAMFNFLKMSLHANELGMPGATHAEDTLYLLGTSGLLSDLYNMVDKDSVERRVVTEFSKLHTDFMSYGSPAPTNEAFKSVEMDQLNFLDVTNKGMIVGSDPNGDRMKFWSNLISIIENNQNVASDN